MSITVNGDETLAAKRTKQTERLAETLGSGFNRAELERFAAIVPLFERLAQQI